MSSIPPPTPNFPGFYPQTPAPGDTTAYSQSEGPLDAAGRDLAQQSPHHNAPAPILLSAAAGLVLGGPLGAVAGAGLAGLGQIENEGLQAKAQAKGLGSNEPIKEEETMPSGNVNLGKSPIAKEVGGGAVPIAAFAGASGAAVLEHEQPEVGTEVEQTNAAGVEREDSVVIPIAVEKDVTPAEREIGGAVPSSLLAGAAGASVLSNEQPPLASSVDETDPAGVATASKEEEEEKKNMRDKVRMGAAGAGLAGIGAYEGTKAYEDHQAASETSSMPYLGKAVKPTPQQSTSAPIASTSTSTQAPTYDSQPTYPTAAEEKAALAAAYAAEAESAQPPPMEDEVPQYEEDHSRGFPSATEEKVALGAGAAGLGAAGLYESTGGLSNSTSSSSAFQEDLPGAASPVPPHLKRPNMQSHFSEVTIAESIIDPAPIRNPYDDQRTTVPPTFFQNDDRTTVTAKAIDPADLVGSTNAEGLRAMGFKEDDGTPLTSEQLDLAHLSSGAGASGYSTPPPRIDSGILPVSSGAVVGEEEEQKKDGNWGKETMAALGGGALVGGAGAAAYEHGKGKGTPTSPTTTSALPRSPEQRNLSKVAAPPAGTGSSDSINTSPATISSTRATRGSPVPGETGTPSRTYAISHPTDLRQIDTSSPSASELNSNVGGTGNLPYNPVERSPHMKIATRKDSVGHKRLHKKSLDPREEQLMRRAGSPTGSSGSPKLGGSPRFENQNGSSAESSPNPNSARSEGEDIWKSSVAHVVNDETAQRGGQRPALVTIDSEDRRDNVINSVAGVPDPTHSPKPRSSPGASPVAPSGNFQEQSPKTGHKLRRSSDARRRSGSVGEGEQKKEGFMSKVFGRGHSRGPSGDNTRSPRTSMDQERR